jgi:hypothetical protein
MHRLVEPMPRRLAPALAAFRGAGGGPSPPAAFDPGAVYFSLETEFSVRGAPLGVTNTGKGAVFYWIYGSPGFGSHPDGSLVPNDIVSTIPSDDQHGSETMRGYNNVLDTAGNVQGVYRLNLSDNISGYPDPSTVGHTYQGGSFGRPIEGAEWIGLLFSYDLSVPTMCGYRCLFRDGAWAWEATFQSGSMTSPNPTFVDFNSPDGFGINQDAHISYGTTFGFAQIVIDLGTCLCDASGVISPTNLAKAITAAGPVDMRSNGYFGRTPELAFDGNPDTFTIPRGTHTGVMAVGGYGDRGKLYAMPFGPSGRPAGKAALIWTGSTATVRGGGTSATGTNNGNPVKLGQFLMAIVSVADNSLGTTHTFADQNGWKVQGQVDWVASGDGAHHAILTKFADAGDVTANLAEKDWTFTWANANSYGYSVSMYAFEGVDPTTPLDAGVVFSNHGSTNGHGNATGAGMICDSITTVTAGCTLINIWGQSAYDGNAAIRPPDGSNLCFKPHDGGFHMGPDCLTAWEYLGAAGATGTRTASTTTAPANPSVGMTLALRPSGA